MASPKSPARAAADGRTSAARGSGEAELRSYRLHERLGQEELATVYRATHTTLDRPVYVYLLRRTDWVSVSRFQLAARLAARLSHPRLLPVIDAGHDDRYGDYLVTPQIDGKRLDELLATGPLDPLLALRIFSQVGEAIDYLHSQQIIHRDVQPANIRVTADGVAYLTNLSLAASPDTPAQLAAEIPEADYLTPYAAPEQSLAEGSADPSLDIYALGAVLFHMLSGEVPPDPTQRPPQLGSQHSALTSADRVLSRLMNKDPLRRYPSAAIASAALRQVLRSQADAASDDMEESQWHSCAEWLDNPLELVFGPMIDQAYLGQSRARADRLHRAHVLRRVLNRWSRQGRTRRRQLGSLMQPQQILSYNVYFYDLRTAYETRTQPEARQRPFGGGTPPLGGIQPEIWAVELPESEPFAATKPQELALPHAERLLTCPDCTRGRIVCQHCNGTGEVPRSRKVHAPDGSTRTQDIPETCPTCRGYRTQPCPRCDGSGQLLEEQIFSWQRRAKLWQNTDDLTGLPEQSLASRAVPVFAGLIDPWDTRWQSLEPLRELLTEATREAGPETRIIAAELTIRGAPLTEIEYSLNERPYRLLISGFGDENEGFDIHSDRGAYDTERIWLYATLVVLATALAVAVFLLS